MDGVVPSVGPPTGVAPTSGAPTSGAPTSGAPMVVPSRALLIEDLASDAELMVLQLEGDGFIVEWQRVQTEPALLAALDTAPDFILSDWRMPRFSGLRALQLVRERGLDTPFIVVSGSIGEELAIDALRLGADDYVLKDRLARLGSAVHGALERQRLHRDRDHAELERARLAAAIEQSSESVLVTDPEGRIEYVNPAFERITGYRRDEAIGQTARILQSGRHPPAFYEAMWRTLLDGRVWTGDIVNQRKDGGQYTDEAVISPVRDDAGATTGYVSIQRDVTVERQAEAREAAHLRERTLIADALGRLRPDDTAEQTAQAVCSQVVQLAEVTMASLLLFEHGGSALPLAVVVKDGRILERLRLTPERSEQLQTRASQGPWVEAWRRRPGHPYLEHHLALDLRGQGYAPILSGSDLIGLLTVGSSDPDAVVLLTARLPALLEFAAMAGALLAPGVAHRTEAARSRSRILGIIDAHAFHPVVQPIVDLGSRVPVGYEALTRFADGTAPDECFHEAARVGVGLELESATLEAAIQASVGLPRWAWLSLNVSPAMLLDSGRLHAILGGLLKASGRRVVLELTEHDSIADYKPLLRAVAKLGPSVSLAVDDAGAGFASLRHILELRSAYVKLDYSLVHGVDRDPARQALIAGMVHFAGQVDCILVAEGVETQAESRTLRTLGIKLGQGYFLGRPDTVDRLEVPGRQTARPTPPRRSERP